MPRSNSRDSSWERYDHERGSSNRSTKLDFYRDNSPMGHGSREMSGRDSRSFHHRHSRSSSPRGRRISPRRSRSPYSRQRNSRSKERYFFVDNIGAVNKKKRNSCSRMEDRYSPARTISSENQMSYPETKKRKSESGDRLHREPDSPDNPFQDRRGDYGDMNSYYNSFSNDKASPSLIEETYEIEPFSGDSSQSVCEWLEHILKCALHHKWDAKMKIFQMTSKLTGFARSWYISLEDTNLSWKQWREKMTKAFPNDEDFFEQLQQMLCRTKQCNETYDKYFCHKMAMLNACDITGKKAVSCVIGGIADKKVNKQAKRAHFATPELLYDFLRNTKEDAVSAKLQVAAAFAKKFPPLGNPHSAQAPGFAGHNDKLCFICGRPGHLARFCRHKDKKFPEQQERQASCYSCGMRGHYGKQCKILSTLEDACGHLVFSSVPVMHPRGERTLFTCYTKFFSDVFINGIRLNGYIDLIGKYVTISQGAAVRNNLSVDRVAVNIEAYGKAITAAVGVTEVTIRVDQAISKMIVYVVADDIQAIPVIVGTSFLKLPQFMVNCRGESVKVHFKTNAEPAASDFALGNEASKNDMQQSF